MAATEGRLRSDHGFVPSIEINGASGAPLISATNLGRIVWILSIDIGVSDSDFRRVRLSFVARISE